MRELRDAHKVVLDAIEEEITVTVTTVRRTKSLPSILYSAESEKSKSSMKKRRRRRRRSLSFPISLDVIQEVDEEA